MGSDGKSKEKNNSRNRSSSSDSGDEIRRKRQRSDREDKGKEKKAHRHGSDGEKKSREKHRDKYHKRNHHANREFQELTNGDNDSVYTNEMENEKNTINCTQNEGDIPRGKAIWDPKSQNIFCDFCIKEVEDGHCPTTYLDEFGYQNLITNMKNATGRDYTKTQLQNKWDALKNDWKLWKQLIGKETGLGWNIKKNTIDASDDWWNSKLQSNPNAAKFRIRGIEPELEQKLNRIFMNIVATGEYTCTASSRRFPSESENPFRDNEYLFEQLESIDESETPRLDKLPEEKNNKRSTEQLEKQNKKMRKGKGQMQVVGAAKLSHQLGPFVDAVESRSSGTSSVKIETPNYSIPRVMEVLDSLPGLEIGSKLYFFATRLFMVKENREIFIALKDDELKLKWLKYEHDA